MGNTPAFQYYPADLVSDPEVMFWDMEQLGAYWQMITYLWLNEGKFEFTLVRLRQLFRKKTQKTAEKLWKSIEKKFILVNGVVTHKRVTEEMQKHSAYRLMKQKAGKKGADKRWEKDGTTISKDIANDSSSVFSLQTTSITPLTPTHEADKRNLSERTDFHLHAWIDISNYKAEMASRVPSNRQMIRADCEIYDDVQIIGAIQEVGPNCYSWVRIRECLLKLARARQIAEHAQDQIKATSERLRKNKERAEEHDGNN